MTHCDKGKRWTHCLLTVRNGRTGSTLSPQCSFKAHGIPFLQRKNFGFLKHVRLFKLLWVLYFAFSSHYIILVHCPVAGCTALKKKSQFLLLNFLLASFVLSVPSFLLTILATLFQPFSFPLWFLFCRPLAYQCSSAFVLDSTLSSTLLSHVLDMSPNLSPHPSSLWPILP